jgi:pre-mRNA-splicing helicase BRR2
MVDDILTHCTADDKPDHFLNIDLNELQLHLDHLSDKALAETLKHGIGYYHEALSKQDKRIVQRLFESGAIQVLVASIVRCCVISF